MVIVVLFKEDHERGFLAVDGARVEGAAGQVDGDAVLARDALRAADVIVVLVGEDDGLELLDVPPHPFQPLARLARPEAGVDQDGGAVALEVVGIARAAGSQGGDDHDSTR
jgi:hypothetical protein